MTKSNDNKLHILEKEWKFKPNLKFKESDLHTVLVRPCNVSYEMYRDFSLGLLKDVNFITHEGAVATWSPNSKNRFKTFEEFMVHLNIDRCITPCIENWMIVDDDWHSWYAKTIDLNTNEVLYDAIESVMKNLSEHYR